MPWPPDTPAPLREVAPKTVARDLVRLVYAIDKATGLDQLTGMQRAEIDALRRAIVKVAIDPDARPTRGVELARLKMYLERMRDGILAKFPAQQRLQVLEALLTVEVGEREVLAALRPAPAEKPPNVAVASGESGRRAAARKRGEARRHAEEARPLDPDAGLARQFARLPLVWRRGIWASAGFGGEPSPAGLARYLLGEQLATVVAALRPAERNVLALLAIQDGVAPAGMIETRFGSSANDGFDWHREPPTSVLGRLRLRGLVYVGRMALPDHPRRRPRVVLVPQDLREPLVRALAACPPAADLRGGIPAEIIEQAMTRAPGPSEVSFAHAQPELFGFARALAARLGRQVKPGHLIKLTAGIWRSFAQAHPQHVPRARARDVDVARHAALEDLAAVETTHIRLLQRRVSRMLTAQPYLYAHVAASLESFRWPEADKLIVFHACDVTIRALHAILAAD